MLTRCFTQSNYVSLLVPVVASFILRTVDDATHAHEGGRLLLTITVLVPQRDQHYSVMAMIQIWWPLPHSISWTFFPISE